MLAVILTAIGRLEITRSRWRGRWRHSSPMSGAFPSSAPSGCDTFARCRRAGVFDRPFIWLKVWDSR